MNSGEKYILGVDGGNSKTDYFLFKTDGILCAWQRAGTCSHEALGGYEKAGGAIQAAMEALSAQSGVSARQIDAAVFGLAGVDIRPQQEEMERVVRSLGFPRALVCNDGFLGIKAGTQQGVGICSISGTGTVTVGVDERANRLQVGGIGPITRDFAGGAYLARQAISAAYAQRFRAGDPFQGTEWIENALRIREKEQWLEKIHPEHLNIRPFMTPLIQHLFDLANHGDQVAQQIVDACGKELAQGVLGCLQNLVYTDTVHIVLAGSIWSKCACQRMKDAFLKRIRQAAPLQVQIATLQAPPVLGAVYWAWELAQGEWAQAGVRSRIQQQIARQKL